MPLLTPVVSKKISSLDAAEGAVPEAIHLQMVRWLAEALGEPLAKNFRQLKDYGSGIYRLALHHYLLIA